MGTMEQRKKLRPRNFYIRQNLCKPALKNTKQYEICWCILTGHFCWYRYCCEALSHLKHGHHGLEEDRRKKKKKTCLKRTRPLTYCFKFLVELVLNFGFGVTSGLCFFVQAVNMGHEDIFKSYTAVQLSGILYRSEKEPQPIYLAELDFRGIIIMTVKQRKTQKISDKQNNWKQFSSSCAFAYIGRKAAYK